MTPRRSGSSRRRTHAALAAFPLVPEQIALVSMSENVTFRVRDRAGGGDWVLRLHRPGYHTLAELDSERTWIRALAAAGIDVPAPLRARDGRDYVDVPIEPLGQHRYAGVSRWTDGDMLARVLHHSESVGDHLHRFEQLGRIAASMHAQTSGWTIPEGFTRHALDADGLVGAAPFWGRFWEHPALSPAERRLLVTTRDRLHATLSRLDRSSAAFGLIHADLHPGNLVVNDERHGDSLTVIDFDDAGFGWYAYDMAVALFNYRHSAQRDGIEAAFLRGYRAIRALPDTTLAMLPMFLLIRSLAIIGWILQRPELDRAEYLRAEKDRICAECAAFAPPV